MDGTGEMAWRGLWRESGVPLSWGGVGLRPPAFPPSSGLGFIAFSIPLPLSWGILPPAFPKRRIVLALRAVHSPLRCRGGPCTTTEKSSRGPQRGPLVFLHPSLAYKSKLLTLGTGTKKALKHRLRAFFRC